MEIFYIFIETSKINKRKLGIQGRKEKRRKEKTIS
jgi:hypothetical protein